VLGEGPGQSRRWRLVAALRTGALQGNDMDGRAGGDRTLDQPSRIDELAIGRRLRVGKRQPQQIHDHLTAG